MCYRIYDNPYFVLVSVNVIGYLKTVIVFVGGYLIFDTVVDNKQVLGIALTLLGVLAYTYVKVSEENQKQQPPRV